MIMIVQVIAGLWVLSILGSRFNFLTLFYIGIGVAFKRVVFFLPLQTFLFPDFILMVLRNSLRTTSHCTCAV